MEWLNRSWKKLLGVILGAAVMVCLGRITLPLYFKYHILIAPSGPESISEL